MQADGGANPYAFTDAATSPGEEARPLGDRLPTGLVVLAILLLIMGAWGALASALAGVGLVVQAAVSSMQIPGADRGSERQQELERQLQANNTFLMPLTFASVGASLLLSIPMLVGAIGLFLRREWARVLTVRTIYVNAVCSALEMILAAVALWLQYAVLIEYMEEAAAAGPLGPSGRTLGYTMVGVQVVGIVLVYAYEFAVYWFGVGYLKRDAIRRLFA